MPCLKSNDGHSELSLELVAPFRYAEEDGYISSVNIVGRHWDGEHTHPLTAFIDGYWVHADSLNNMRSAMDKWVRLSLTEQAATEFTGDFELARLPGQVFSCAFGPRDDTIDSGSPVLSICISTGSLCLSYHFVTDQSCLRFFLDELHAHMNSGQDDQPDTFGAGYL